MYICADKVFLSFTKVLNHGSWESLIDWSTGAEQGWCAGDEQLFDSQPASVSLTKSIKSCESGSQVLQGDCLPRPRLYNNLVSSLPSAVNKIKYLIFIFQTLDPNHSIRNNFQTKMGEKSKIFEQFWKLNRWNKTKEI